MSTVFDLTDKVAIVTGGNGGIGYGIARGLAAAGANIVVAARQPAKTAQAVTAKLTRSPRTSWLCQPGSAKDK
jgi:2-deoxy-D-gluconate 3-dehydrogenase